MSGALETLAWGSFAAGFFWAGFVIADHAPQAWRALRSILDQLRD